MLPPRPKGRGLRKPKTMTQPRSHCKALQSPRPFRFWNTTPDAGGREQSRHESETAQPFPSCWITCIGIGSPAHPCTFISTAFNASGSSKTSIIKERKTIEREPTVDGQRSQEIFINGAEDFYSLSANPQFSNVAELFDAWLTEHDRQLLAKTETEAGKRISSELKLEHASDAHARTEPSRAYIQGCKAARSLLEDAIRDMTQEQGTL